MNHSPLTGALLGGRYRVGVMLGTGGMGAVYEGVQEGLDRKVALKVIHPHLAGDRELLGRFQREAHVVAALGHPNVVQISDFQTPAGELPFLVMELLRGENLRQVLKRTPQLPQARVAYIAMQVLSALDAAHRANIVHRDIKPDNIFLERTSVQADIVKVLDFGVAKLLGGEDEAANKLTRQGFVVGTLAYMAPEQATGEGVDGRSDLYALGACMYVALAGRKPFEAPSTTALLRAMLGEPPVPLTAIRQDLHDGLWQVVARALAKKKEDRFATAAEMARALAPFAQPTTLEVAQAPDARVSDPAPSTLPDDSMETPPPRTAPLPMQPAPATQPMPAIALPMARTARIAPVPLVALQPLTYQASPPPVDIAPWPPPAKRSRSRAGWFVAVAALLVVVAVPLFAFFRRDVTGAPPGATPSATIQTTHVTTAGGVAAPAASALTAIAPSATEPVPRIVGASPPPPTTTATTAATTAPHSTLRQPLVCEVARQMREHGETVQAKRLAVQCTAQGGTVPF